MDGIAAAQEMRDRWQLPVVVLTAHSEDSSLDRAKRTEPFGYLLKPFDDRELKSTIEMALYRHRSEVEIRRLNRLYAVLSQVQQGCLGSSAFAASNASAAFVVCESAGRR
jgi:two-component system, cell cycle sensor histidine kinase and response regulator CckA